MILIHLATNLFIESSEAAKMNDESLEQIPSLLSRQKFHFHLEGKVAAQTQNMADPVFLFSKRSNLR